MKRSKRCPKCGSTKIQWASGLPQLWSIWECRKCGYRGALVVEEAELAEQLGQRHRTKTREEDTKA